MPDWLMLYLGSLQGGIVRSLAVELRAGGLGTAFLAFALGALHALTPGHGKVALTAYFLGRKAHIGKGLRVALSAALLHVLSGFALFLILELHCRPGTVDHWGSLAGFHGCRLRPHHRRGDHDAVSKHQACTCWLR